MGVPFISVVKPRAGTGGVAKGVVKKNGGVEDGICMRIWSISYQ